MKLARSSVLIGALVGAPICASVVGNADFGISLGGMSPTTEPVRVEAILRSDSAGTVGDSIVVELRLLMSPGIHIYASESLFFKIEETRVEGLGPVRIDLPQPQRHRNFDGTTALVFANGSVMRIAHIRTHKRWCLEGYIQYQACDDRMCFLPKKVTFQFGTGVKAGDTTGREADSDEGWEDLAQAYEVRGSIAGYVGAKEFLQFLDEPSRAPHGNVFGGSGGWVTVLVVALGGLLLNLTPCVLPLIPVTLTVIGAGAEARSRREGVLAGAVYGLGMALAYGIAGSAVIVSGTAFGGFNSSAAFNLGVAIVFVLLGLAMFDVVHIDFSRFRGRVRPDMIKKGKLLGVFALGALSALLAGACVAPVVISVLVHAASQYAQGNVWALAWPLVLGIGMAFPWPFVGGGIALFPKPGKWMVWVRNGMGILIVVLGLYYGFQGVRLMQRKPDSNTSTIVKDGTGSTASDELWVSSLSQGLSDGLALGKPVLIDFWATWCKNCEAMELTTLREPAVREKLRNFIAVKYQAEKPYEEPARSVLKRFGVRGLPTYVVLEEKKSTD